MHSEILSAPVHATSPLAVPSISTVICSGKDLGSRFRVLVDHAAPEAPVMRTLVSQSETNDPRGTGNSIDWVWDLLVVCGRFWGTEVAMKL